MVFSSKNVFPIGIVTLPSAASALKMRSASASVGRLRERDTQSKSVGPDRMQTFADGKYNIGLALHPGGGRFLTTSMKGATGQVKVGVRRGRM